jgi:hypothetical protein
MSSDTDNFNKWDDELSPRETFLIGKVIAQWGALEHEVFEQTLMTFDTPVGDDVPLPKAMNNLQFTGILSLWKERVVDKTEGERGNVLQQQYEIILKLKEYRDALVHGMWQWSKDELSRISTVRIRKKEIISVHFTADDLNEFYSRLGSTNFKLRFPGGLEEYAQKQPKEGFYFSRLGLSMMTGGPLAEEWLSSIGVKKDDEDRGGHDA